MRTSPVCSSPSVLLVDSDQRARQASAAVLRQAGYVVVTAATPHQGLEQVQDAPVDLIVVEFQAGAPDPMAPVSDLKKQCPRTPVIVLTSQASLETAIRSVQLGVRDYLVKPVAPTHLAARVAQVVADREREGQQQEILTQLHHLLQRLRLLSQTEPGAEPAWEGESQYLRCGPFRLDLIARRATREGAPISLPPSGFDYLASLMRHSPQPVPYETLVAEAQGGARADGNHLRDLARWQVHRLRRLIGDDSRRPRHIITVRGVGYCLVP